MNKYSKIVIILDTIYKVRYFKSYGYMIYPKYKLLNDICKFYYLDPINTYNCPFSHLNTTPSKLQDEILNYHNDENIFPYHETLFPHCKTLDDLIIFVNHINELISKKTDGNK